MAIHLTDEDGKQFIYQDIMPFRFVEQKVANPKYATKTFDDFFDDCFAQPWCTQEGTMLQILSDFEFTFDVYFADGLQRGELKQSYTPLDKGIVLSGQTFKVWEVSLDFPLYDEGKYFIEIVIDSWPNPLQSEPFEIFATAPENTLLFEYKKTEVDGLVVWYEGFTPSFRIYGGINLFKPGFEDTDFIDQEYNVTLLDSVVFRSFTLNVGNADGVPDWTVDKVNRILSCDILSADGDFYQKNDGAEWSLKRPDPTTSNQKVWSGASIEIIPVDNNDELELEIDTSPEQDTITIVSKSIKFDNNGSDLVIPNIFSSGVVLQGIKVEAAGGLPIPLTIGTSVGGTQISKRVVELTEDDSWLEIGYPFKAIQTVYIGGLAGKTTDVYVYYLDLDAQPIPIGQNTVAEQVGLYASIYYSPPTQQDFEDNFDTVTGLGKVDTKWVDWKIDDSKGKFVVSWDGTDYILGGSGGSNEIVLTTPNLPSIIGKLWGQEGNKPGFGGGRQGRWITHNGSGVNAGDGYYTTENMGGTAAPITAIPEYAVKVLITRYQETV